MRTSSELAAFPTCVREAAAEVLPFITAGQFHPPSSNSYRVLVDGEALDVPRRVYYDADRVREAANRDDVLGRIALCLGTLHHDGFLREECVERLMHDDHSWVVPFIINLVGEYVLEIIIRIERAMPLVDGRVYGDFLICNPTWFSTIERRVVSYWDVYYRTAFPQFAAYPGARVVDRLRHLVQQSNLSFQRTAGRSLT